MFSHSCLPAFPSEFAPRPLRKKIPKNRTEPCKTPVPFPPCALRATAGSYMKPWHRKRVRFQIDFRQAEVVIPLQKHLGNNSLTDHAPEDEVAIFNTCMVALQINRPGTIH